MRGLLCGIIGLVAAGSSIAQVPPPAASSHPGTLMFSPAEEQLYLQRFEKTLANQRAGVAEDYDPRETVPGAAPWTPLPAAAPAERTISDAALKQAMDYAGVNNSDAFMVWRRGKVEAENFFGRTKTDPIVSKSLSKPLTAVAVGRAIALGKIKSLDQPVADFVHEWRADPRRSKILVRHLLDMRSGFLAQAFAADPNDLLNRAYQHPRHDEIIVAEYPVIDEPGTRYEYNNATSEMVAVLIARATGRRYAEFVGTEIWQKIGALGGEVWVNRKDGMAHSGCCMLVPAESFLRLGILLMKDGVWEGQRLLPKGYVKDIATGTPQYPHAGAGVYVAGTYVERRGPANPDRKFPGTLHSEPYLADDLFLFDGNANQVVFIIPSEDMVILRTGNIPPRAQGKEWDNTVLPNTLIRGIVKAKGASKPQKRAAED